MGANCCADEAMSAAVSAPPKAEIKDLPPVNFERISNPYEKFEASLPFNRITIKDMNDRIDKAVETETQAANPVAEGDEQKEVEPVSYVTLKTLRKHLPTPAWEGLSDESSKVGKVLMSSAFKSDGTEAGQIHVDWLRAFALLHCAGKPAEKSVALYDLLQEGGLSAHTQISAGDKDLIPIFKKICEFVTKDVFELTASIDGGIESPYPTQTVSKLLDTETMEIVREEQWLEEVYGAQSRLDNEVWLEKVTKTAKWIYIAKDLRKKLFEVANVSM